MLEFKRKLLIVDGNYIAHRAIGILNMGEDKNYLETAQEKNNFLTTLNSSIMQIQSSFMSFVDNSVIVVDNYSWRKEIIPVKPYYVKDDVTPIKYKENRTEKKEESPIDYNTFNLLYHEFIETLKQKTTVCDVKGLEGDDDILLLSNKIVEENPDTLVIVLCTDGDLEQVVSNNCILMRNIRSKDAPYGEFVINQKMYDSVFKPTSIEDVFLGNTLDATYFNELFRMSILQNISNVNRSLNKGIKIAEPNKVALVKSICGDKKDNLFPIFRWQATTGTRNYKVTENHIEKAFKAIGENFTDEACYQALTDKDTLVSLIVNLRAIVGQTVQLSEAGKILKHNLQLNVLKVSNLPEKYVELFDEYWMTNNEKIMLKKESIVVDLPTVMRDTAINLFEDSIPDDLKF